MKRALVGVFAVAFLPSCGGGGSTPSGPSAPTAPAATPTPAPSTVNIEARSTDTPRAIGNMATLESLLVVAEAGAITDLSIDVNIEHTWRGDLEIDIVQPDGTGVRLFTGTLNDGTDNVVQLFTRSNTPDLSRLLNKGVTGTWRLVITDRQPLDKGTLGSWTLRATVRR